MSGRRQTQKDLGQCCGRPSPRCRHLRAAGLIVGGPGPGRHRHTPRLEPCGCQPVPAGASSLEAGGRRALGAWCESQPQTRARDFSSDQGAEPQSYWSISRILQRRAGGKDPLSARSEFHTRLLGQPAQFFNRGLSVGVVLGRLLGQLEADDPAQFMGAWRQFLPALPDPELGTSRSRNDVSGARCSPRRHGSRCPQARSGNADCCLRERDRRRRSSRPVPEFESMRSGDCVPERSSRAQTEQGAIAPIYGCLADSAD